MALKRTQKAGNIISREFEILDMLRGKENIVQLLDFFYSIDDKARIIQNTVLEYCDESLEDVLRSMDKTKEYLPMEDIKKYTKQIFNGLKNMHAVGICHRDLKPENLLLDENSGHAFLLLRKLAMCLSKTLYVCLAFRSLPSSITL